MKKRMFTYLMISMVCVGSLVSQTQTVTCPNGKFTIEGDENLIIICKDDGDERGVGYVYNPPQDSTGQILVGKELLEKIIFDMTGEHNPITSDGYNQFLQTGMIESSNLSMSLHLPVETIEIENNPGDEIIHPGLDEFDDLIDHDPSIKIELQKLIEAYLNNQDNEYTDIQKLLIEQEIKNLESDSYTPSIETLKQIEQIIKR